MNEAAYRASRHEAAHAAAAVLLGWPVTGLERGADFSGETFLDSQTHGDIKERGTELGIILLAPMLIDPAGCEADLRTLSGLCDLGISLAAVWGRTEDLIRTPGFFVKRQKLETALLAFPKLSGVQVAELVA